MKDFTTPRNWLNSFPVVLRHLNSLFWRCRIFSSTWKAAFLSCPTPCTWILLRLFSALILSLKNMQTNMTTAENTDSNSLEYSILSLLLLLNQQQIQTFRLSHSKTHIDEHLWFIGLFRWSPIQTLTTLKPHVAFKKRCILPQQKSALWTPSILLHTIHHFLSSLHLFLLYHIQTCLYSCRPQ